MKFVICLKRISDICFYMAFAGYLGMIFGADSLFSALPWFAAATFGSVYLNNYGPLRFAPYMLLLGMFLTVSPSTANLAVLLPICVYLIYNSVNPLVSVGWDENVSRFKLFIKIALALTIVSPVIGLRYYLESSLLPYAMMYFICSVVMLRMARHDENVLSDMKYGAMTLISVLTIFVLGFIISLEIALIVSFIYFTLLVPIFAVIIAGVVWLLRDFEPGTPRWVMPYEVDDFGATFALLEWLDEYVWPAARFDGMNNVLRVVLIVLILAGIMYFVIRLFSSREREHKTASAGTMREIRNAVEASTTVRRKYRRRNNQIREIYRKLLIKCRAAGMSITGNMTSLDIERIAQKKFNCPQTSELRDMYVQVRYNNAEFTKQDVIRAKALYKQASEKLAMK